jgi:hypothetical protein
MRREAPPLSQRERARVRENASIHLIRSLLRESSLAMFPTA